MPYSPSSAASFCRTLSLLQSVRFMSHGLVKLDVSDGIARFDVGERDNKNISEKKGQKTKKKKKSKRAKKNELRFFRLKAKKKLKHSNPEVRIRYKLEKAKRKETWLIEKLLKYEIPKAQGQKHDPERLTAEERFYLKRIGQKYKHYVPVGRRGIFGGVILNMHLHWKKHETVKVICKPCKPGQVHQYAEEIARLSEGIVIDMKGDNTIIFYRGKNYVRPEILSPKDTLSKKKALDKYKFEQSLDSVKDFIGALEKELENYHRHVALYGNPGAQGATIKTTEDQNDDEVNLVDACMGQGAVNYGSVHGRIGVGKVASAKYYRSSLDSNCPLSDSVAKSEEANPELCKHDSDHRSECKIDSFSSSETEEENSEYLTSDVDYDFSTESENFSSDPSETEEP
eukprot:Gb_06284 [translate_table: standard]